MGAEHPSPEQEEGVHDCEPLIVEKEGKRETGDLPVSTFTFKSSPRPARDTLFAILFVAAVLASYGIGFFAVRNADFHPEPKLRFMRYNPESNECERIQHAYVGTTPTHNAVIPERRDYETGHEARRHSELGSFLVPVVVTAGITIPVGLALLYLLYRYTREAVFAILALMCIVPVSFFLVAGTVYLTSQTCATMSTSAHYTVGFLSFAAIVTFLQFLVVCKNRSRLLLTVQVLKTSLEALKQNMSLLLFAPVLGLATAVINAPIGVFAWYALSNGRVAPNFDAIDDPSNQCLLSTGAPCCTYQRSNWVTPYLVLSGGAMLWVMLVAGQLQILVVSGTVSQWYFAASGSFTAGATKRALMNAFGPSFGTACLSSLMITISMVLKSLMDRSAVVLKVGSGVVAVFLRACFGWLFQLFEFFTRFTTNFAAISGDGFWAAARATSDLLRRNWLSTRIVEVLVQNVLTGMALTLAMLHFGVVFEFTRNRGGGEPLVTANTCFLVALLGLGQLYHFISAAVDTVYICYAMDKDRGVVSQVDVHDVYRLLLPASDGRDETMLAVRSSEP